MPACSERCKQYLISNFGLKYLILLTGLLSLTYLKIFVMGCFLASTKSFFGENQNSKYRVHIKVASILRKIKEMKFYSREWRKQAQS